MKQHDEFVLIEHLQVMDEPLSSLYADHKSGKYFLSVRLYENIEDKSYLFSEVVPKLVLKYISGQLGLKTLFETEPSFYYRVDGQHVLSLRNFIPLSREESCKRLSMDGSLGDMYDIHLAYRSTNLKKYLTNL